MVLGNRGPVIHNIQSALERQDYNCKVETGDPVLDLQGRKRLLEQFVNGQDTISYRVKNCVADHVLDILTAYWNRDTEIQGLENIREIGGGAIVTVNHFHPFENTAVRKLVKNMCHRDLYIVSQETNLAMRGVFGFFMRYVNMIPMSSDREWLNGTFDRMTAELLQQKKWILIYPEQEMWYNYRKPRPLKRGAYLYAAKNHVPIVSCFTEIRELPEKETEEFYRTRYVLHVLTPVYPMRGKSVRENSVCMQERDYEQKKQAYEAAYGKRLTYEFSEWDIAGWRGNRYSF